MNRTATRIATAAAGVVAATVTAVSFGAPAHAVSIATSVKQVSPTETQTSYIVMLDSNEKMRVAMYDAYWTGKVCSDIVGGTGYAGNCQTMVQTCVRLVSTSSSLPMIYIRPDGRYECSRY
jgi:hypothetical protein